MTIKILTAASERYAKALFALIGSMNCNWPNHPPIIVYDIGLEEKTLKVLKNNNIEVIKVPEFCEHWRKYYTWKIWCLKNTEADIILYFDSGLCVLKNLDEIIDVTKRLGYFLVPNGQLLDWEASNKVCVRCGVSTDFRKNKGTIAGTLLGLNKKDERIQEIIDDAYRISFFEDSLKPQNEKNKHDQALLSILSYKKLVNPILQSEDIYLNYHSPKAEIAKIWLHRRGILSEDIRYFSKYVGNQGPQYIPKDPQTDINYIRSILHSNKPRIKTVIKKIIPLILYKKFLKN